MCGICGFVGFEDPELLTRMTRLIAYRGPDESGFYLGEMASLGHARLSIIDLSQAARQPMSSEDGRVKVVCNGEIYNYRELRKKLEGKGHQFNSQCDTEVIVHAYEEEGERFLEKLNGCFALAVWDEGKGELLLARDRLGIRPLYYASVGSGLVFASEVKSILLHPQVKREIDYSSLDQYLALRYIPGDGTMFEGIDRLPPACSLRFSEGKSQVKRYWELDFYEGGPKKEGECVEEFEALLSDSIRLRLMSDVSLGAFLSGGVDSATIVGLMSQVDSAPVKTYSIGFGDEIDELAEAREVSRLFHTEHCEILVEKQSYGLLPEIVWHLDEPVGDAIVIPTYLLCKSASDSVRVVLTGEGADEIMGGYVHQISMHIGNAVHRAIPGSLMRLLEKGIGGLPVALLNRLFNYPANLGEQGKKKLQNYLSALGSQQPGKAYLALASAFDWERRTELYDPDLLRDSRVGDGLMEERFDRFLQGDGSHLNRVVENDMHSWLPNYTLLKQDRLAAANGLEGRVPFLDHRLVEFCASLPGKLKLKRLTGKYLLRRCAEKVLPEDRAWAPKKPFYFPLERCFGEDFDEYVRELLGRESILGRGIFNWKFVDKLMEKVRGGEIVHNKQIMVLVILETWFRLFIDGEGFAENGN